MGIWTAIHTAYTVAQEATGATHAATGTLARGGSPLEALRAFAAQTDGKIDDAVVDELATALTTGIAWLAMIAQNAETTVSWLTEHRSAIVAVVDTGLGMAIDIGYRAACWRVKLETWRD